MNNTTFLTLVFILLFILGIKSNISPLALKRSIGAQVVITAPKNLDLIHDFQKSFAGAIDNADTIQMTLIKTGGSLNGSYQYVGRKNNLKIIGNVAETGDCSFQEFNEEHHITGIFEGQFIDNQLKGNWSNPDGSKILPFKMKENKNVSDSKVSENMVVCSEEIVKNQNTTNPIIVKNCLFKDYKAVSIGRMNANNQYYYVHDLLENQNGKYIKITNTSFFNDNQKQLLSLINQEIQKKYMDISANPTTLHCFEGKAVPHFQMDDINIIFDDINISFNVNFGLIGACAIVDEITISFPIKTIEPYLK